MARAPIDAEEETIDLAVIGGGPAGLAAAEEAAARLGPSASIMVFDAKPSLGRKLLMAGKSGLNITHSEPFEAFLSRYRGGGPALAAALRAHPPAAVRAWMEGLGQEAFIGSSGRVFPKAMKASPLLRAWLERLAGKGAALRPRWRWIGAEEGAAGRGAGHTLLFETETGVRRVRARSAVFALGGASWPRLGSDGAWAEVFRGLGVEVAPFQPANIGWNVAWSAHFKQRFAGAPIKSLRISAGGEAIDGELVVTRSGLEGGPIYALTPALRSGAALSLDLAPGRRLEALIDALARPRGKLSRSNWLRRGARLDPLKISLLREPEGAQPPEDPSALAQRIKALPLPLIGSRPMEEGISTAGGVVFSALTERLEIAARPGWFVCGEMLDWDAPTGGYLLTACLATGRLAGAAAAERLAR